MAAPQATLLLLEDDASLRRMLCTSLTAEGYRVVEAATAHRGAIDAATHKPDLAIVDLGLPDGDGLDVVRSIREWSSMPIVVLSARLQEGSKVAALDAGADDYVTKPFGVGELFARLRVALRHAARTAAGERSIALDGVIVDLERRVVQRDGEELKLTPIEFRLIALLARHAGMIVTQRQLLREIWGPTHETDTHYLRVYMKQLRAKVERDPSRPRHLLTEIGVGYRLAVDEASASDSPAASRPM